MEEDTSRSRLLLTSLAFVSFCIAGSAFGSRARHYGKGYEDHCTGTPMKGHAFKRVVEK
jgi:hypothetical protein